MTGYYYLSPMGYYYDLDPDWLVWLVQVDDWIFIDIITCLPWVAIMTLTLSGWLATQVQADD